MREVVRMIRKNNYDGLKTQEKDKKEKIALPAEERIKLLVDKLKNLKKYKQKQEAVFLGIENQNFKNFNI
jgi:hypothetical protein